MGFSRLVLGSHLDYVAGCWCDLKTCYSSDLMTLLLSDLFGLLGYGLMGFLCSTRLVTHLIMLLDVYGVVGWVLGRSWHN